MQLVRLVYVSTLNLGADPSSLTKIHETALAANARFDISGMLVFGNDYFLQCLEGGRTAVNQLYSNIASDKRHVRNMLLEYSEIVERDFAEWSMKLVVLNKETAHLLRVFSAESNFNPYKLSAQSAHRLMLSLRQVD